MSAENGINHAWSYNDSDSIALAPNPSLKLIKYLQQTASQDLMCYYYLSWNIPTVIGL